MVSQSLKSDLARTVNAEGSVITEIVMYRNGRTEGDYSGKVTSVEPEVAIIPRANFTPPGQYPILFLTKRVINHSSFSGGAEVFAVEKT